MNITDVTDLTKGTLIDITGKLWEFIEKQNIIGSSLGIIIGNYVRDLSNAISNGIIIPIIKGIRGEKKDEKIEKIFITIFGIDFRLDEIIGVLTNMIVILLIFFGIMELIPKFIIQRFVSN